jgi:hypothetical protein
VDGVDHVYGGQVEERGLADRRMPDFDATVLLYRVR